jgi:hypothetical protein
MFLKAARIAGCLLFLGISKIQKQNYLYQKNNHENKARLVL